MKMKTWFLNTLTDLRRLKWILLFGFGAIYLIDGGLLLQFARLQLIVYKLAVSAIAVAFAQLVWAGVFPYVSVREAIRDYDGDAALAVCVLRAAVFVGIVLSITLGL